MADNLVLQSTIKYLLQEQCLMDALFLAELFLTESTSCESAYLLGVCLYRLRKFQQCRHLLTNYPDDSHCVLLFAKCCLELEDYQSGIAHLHGLLCLATDNKETITVNKFGQDTGIAFLLLGDLNRKINLTKEACKAYRQALSYNPFLWTAFESLCQLERGTTSGISVNDIFKTGTIPNFLQQNININQQTEQHHKIISSSPVVSSVKQSTIVSATPNDTSSTGPGYVTPDLFAVPVPPTSFGAAIASSTPTLHNLATNLQFGIDRMKPLTPGQFSPKALTFTPTSVNQAATDYSITQAPFKAKQIEVESDTGHTTTTGSVSPITETESTPDLVTLQEIPHNLRRSARLGGVNKSSSSLVYSRHRTEMIPSPLTVARSKSQMKATTGKTSSPTGKKQRQSGISTNTKTNPIKKPKNLSPFGVDENKPQSEIKEQDEKMDTLPFVETEDSLGNSIKKIMSLLQKLGRAYCSLINYQVKDTLIQLRQLPLIHQNSLWGLTQFGQAMIIGENFKEAARYFSEIHRIDPHRQEGMDLYGSALWHLQRETELVLLAEKLEKSDRKQPQVFCVLSSLMNYYRDHDSAIRYLERAIQLAPSMPYPQTLLGLEYTLIKDYDKALTAFQSATSIDPHHYNAWYGLSHLYLQQEKWSMAEVSIKKAISLNPQSSIAYTQFAMIQQKQGRLASALQTIDKAISCNSLNHLPKYHRALILESLDHFNESYDQLNELTAPLAKEPSLYKALSRVLLKLGRPQEAVLHMAWAMDYSHSSSGMIAGMALVKGPHSTHNPLDEIEGLVDDITI